MILTLIAVILILAFSYRFITIILSAPDIIAFAKSFDFWFFLIVYLIIVGVGYTLKKVDSYEGD